MNEFRAHLTCGTPGTGAQLYAECLSPIKMQRGSGVLQKGPVPPNQKNINPMADYGIEPRN